MIVRQGQYWGRFKDTPISMCTPDCYLLHPDLHTYIGYDLKAEKTQILIATRQHLE